jgi:hypothetical protein
MVQEKNYDYDYFYQPQSPKALLMVPVHATLLVVPFTTNSAKVGA